MSNEQFVAEPMRASDIRPAYPLIRNTLPNLSFAEWVRFARRAQASKRTGIMVVRGARPFPVGLFCYRTERDLAQGMVLVAHHFVALELLDTCPVTTALVRGLDELAVRLGCDSVHSILHGPEEAMAACFEHSGHTRAAALYRKSVRPPGVSDFHKGVSAPALGGAL